MIFYLNPFFFLTACLHLLLKVTHIQFLHFTDLTLETRWSDVWKMCCISRWKTKDESLYYRLGVCSNNNIFSDVTCNDKEYPICLDDRCNGRCPIQMDLFPHMHEASNGPENIWFHVLISCSGQVYTHNIYLICATWEENSRIWSLKPDSVKATLNNMKKKLSRWRQLAWLC